MTGETVVEIRDLEVVYNKLNGPVFTGLNLSFQRGEAVLILGPNGGGKTTVIKSIVGLVKPRRGSVSVLGVDPISNPWIRREIGYVPQVDEINIYAPITLWDFVLMGRYPRIKPGGKISAEDEEKVGEAIKRVALQGREEYRLYELSGGQLARAMIARALAQDPQIYLLDEPFESIDFRSEDLITDVLLEEAGRGRLVVLTEHHITDVDRFTRAILFNRGVVADGKPSEVVRKEVLERAYGVVE